jgi:hypothetical protein
VISENSVSMLIKAGTFVNAIAPNVYYDGQYLTNAPY